jgi:hypothetical protein
MDLYDVKARGIRSPLNSREISHLFRSGHLHRRVRCKPKGEANWQTVGELFPLLEYGIGGYSLPPEDAKPAARRLVLAFAGVAALLATGIFFYCNRSARDFIDVRSAAESLSHPVAESAVLARGN